MLVLGKKYEIGLLRNKVVPMATQKILQHIACFGASVFEEERERNTWSCDAHWNKPAVKNF